MRALNVRAKDPNGEDAPWFRQSVIAEDGIAQFSLPIAHNERVSEWVGAVTVRRRICLAWPRSREYVLRNANRVRRRRAERMERQEAARLRSVHDQPRLVRRNGGAHKWGRRTGGLSLRPKRARALDVNGFAAFQAGAPGGLK